MTNMTRRSFAVASVAGVGALTQTNSRAQVAPNSANPIAVFAKHVQAMGFDELGRRLASVKVDGIEATLRNGGQIEPKDLKDRLGGLCETLDKHGQRVVIAASDVNEINSDTERYLRTLAEYQIPYFRMAYYRYDFSQPVLPQLDAFAKKAVELAELCKALNLTALYQNHAGRNYVGAGIWDLQRVLSNISPKHLAAAFDIRHASLELTQSFEAGYSAIRGQVGATYVKDFDWVDGKPTNVPLGQGRVKPLFDIVRKDGFVGPLSLHMEYTDHRDPAMVETSWNSIVADVATLHDWLI